MAFNDANQNNNNSTKKQNKETYSAYDVGNPEGVDPSKLSYKYWSNNLCISISPVKKNAGNSGNVSYDYENNASIYLTHHNARMFKMLLDDWKKHPANYHNVGVSTRSGVRVGVSDGKEFGANGPCLFIINVNENTGKPDSSFVYEFRRDIYHGITDYNIETGDFNRVLFDNLEVDELCTVLETYVNSMTYAYAYSVREEMKYDISRLNTKVDSICEKLGIEFKGNGGNTNSGYNKANDRYSSTTRFGQGNDGEDGSGDFNNGFSNGKHTNNSSLSDLDDGLE